MKHRNSLGDDEPTLLQPAWSRKSGRIAGSSGGRRGRDRSPAASPRTRRIPRCDIKKVFFLRREGGSGDLNKYAGVRGSSSAINLIRWCRRVITLASLPSFGWLLCRNRCLASRRRACHFLTWCCSLE
jgi:hypothetical protein